MVPLFEPPDEIWHFAFADHLAKGGGLPVFAEKKSAFLREGGQPPLYYAAVALAILPFDRSDFPSWVRFNASHPAVTRGATSDTPNVFIHTAREDWPWTGSVLAVHVARLVSLLFGALTVVGVYRCWAHRHGPRGPGAAERGAHRVHAPVRLHLFFGQQRQPGGGDGGLGGRRCAPNFKCQISNLKTIRGGHGHHLGLGLACPSWVALFCIPLIGLGFSDSLVPPTLPFEISKFGI